MKMNCMTIKAFALLLFVARAQRPPFENTETCGDFKCEGREMFTCPEDCAAEITNEVCSCVIEQGACEQTCDASVDLGKQCGIYVATAVCGNILPPNVVYADYCGGCPSSDFSMEDDLDFSTGNGEDYYWDSSMSTSNQPELSMAELHEIGQCRPCAYHCHKEDGCRRGADCTFCHMCGPEMLRTRRKEKAKRIKSEMKLRKQEEKEKTKKNNEREAYLNFNTPTNSTKLSSYAHGVDSTMLTSTYASGVDSHMLASPFHFQDRTSEMSNPLLRRPYVSGLNSQTVSMAQGFDPVLH